MSTQDLIETPVVLVVEDEVLIREDVIDVLEREGFRTLSAGTVSEALAVLDRHEDIQAVFTDIQMPGMSDGVDLAKQVAADRPGIVIVVTSGRSLGAPDDLPHQGRFVAKPYVPSKIAKLLRELIDDGPGWDPGYGMLGGSNNSPSPGGLAPSRSRPREPRPRGAARCVFG
jgi:CheY-like chemotaxis protein